MKKVLTVVAVGVTIKLMAQGLEAYYYKKFAKQLLSCVDMTTN